MTTIDANTGFTLGKRILLYLRNGKKYVIKTNLLKSSYPFIKILKKKNPDLFIGNIKDYKIQKENKKYLENLKRETKT